MSIMSLFGGLAQSAINYQSNKETNATNKQISEMNNIFNQEMWEREKEYNSPLAQMKRLQDAGINPAFAYSNGISNTVSSAPTAANSIPMQPYVNNELAEIGNRMSLDSLRGIQGDEAKSRMRVNDSTIVENLSSASRNNAEIQKLNTEVGYLGEKIYETKAQTDYYKSLKSGKDIENAVNEAVKNDKIIQAQIQTDKERKALELLISQVALNKADTAKRYKDMRIDESRCIQEIKESCARMKKIGAEARGLELANQLSEESMAFLLSKIELDSQTAEIKVNLARLEQFTEELRIGVEGNYVYQFLSSLFGLGGDFFGSGGAASFLKQ